MKLGGDVDLGDPAEVFSPNTKNKDLRPSTHMPVTLDPHDEMEMGKMNVSELAAGTVSGTAVGLPGPWGA